MMSAAIVIDDIVRGHFRFTYHALLRMKERFIDTGDIKHCALSGVIELSDNKYVISGCDQTDAEMKIICVYDDGVLIITVY